MNYIGNLTVFKCVLLIRYLIFKYLEHKNIEKYDTIHYYLTAFLMVMGTTSLIILHLIYE